MQPHAIWLSTWIPSAVRCTDTVSLPCGVVIKPLAYCMLVGSWGWISYFAKSGSRGLIPKMPENSCLAGAPNMGWQWEPDSQCSQIVVAPWRYMYR